MKGILINCLIGLSVFCILFLLDLGFVILAVNFSCKVKTRISLTRLVFPNRWVICSGKVRCLNVCREDCKACRAIFLPSDVFCRFFLPRFIRWTRKKKSVEALERKE